MVDRSSNEMVEVSANDERWMCGLVRDDDEIDLCKDAAELFGHSIEAPINVGDDDPEGRGGGEEEEDEKGINPS